MKIIIFIIFFILSINSLIASETTVPQKRDWKKIRQKHKLRREKNKDIQILKASKKPKIDKRLIPLTNAIYICRKFNPGIKGEKLTKCIKDLRSGKYTPKGD